MPELTTAQILIANSTSDGTLSKSTTHGRYSTYRAMRYDPTIALARQLVIAPILASNWSVEQEEDAPDELVGFINEQLLPSRIHILMNALLGCIDFGWQPFEKVFEVQEGRIVIAKLKPLLQDYTQILVDAKTGAYVGLRQHDLYGNVLDLPVDNTLLFNVNVEGTYWYGDPIMEIARSPYEKWLEVEEAATKYDRKIAGSHWVIHYPPGTSVVNGVTTDNFTVATQLLSSLEASGAIAIPRHIEGFVDDLTKDAPDAWKIELLSDAGAGGQSFYDRQRYLDALKVRAFGVPERSVLEGQFGTKAEAEQHADLAITGMEIRHKLFVQTINWHLVNQLIRLNFGSEYENKVYLNPAPITDLSISFLREVYKQILSTPDGLLLEMNSLDFESLKDRLDLPIVPDLNVDVQRSSYEEPVVFDPLARSDASDSGGTSEEYA